jgi:hypothetical protein
MIRRRDNDRVVITQTAHSWLAGQFALHWGNDQFRMPGLTDEVKLAAANHDNGWFDWEKAPLIGPDGRPLDFIEMPVETHLALWRRGLATLEEQSHYAALLVSKHARFLVEGRLRNNPGTEAEAAQLSAFSQAQSQWEAAAADKLQSIAYYETGCQPHILEANLRLLQIFDWLSLLLCMKEVAESTIVDVPGQSANHRLEIRLRPLGPCRFTIDPWPFGGEKFEMIVQARELPTAIFDTDEAFQAAWQSAEIKPLAFEAIRES